jgi:hypothetical protein
MYSHSGICRGPYEAEWRGLCYVSGTNELCDVRFGEEVMEAALKVSVEHLCVRMAL